jgi:membrane associated rhomboid family serine protease
MFLFTSLILPLENILSHSKLGALVAIIAIVGVATRRGRATTIVTSPLLSFEKYEKFGGGSYTINLLSHLLKLNT